MTDSITVEIPLPDRRLHQNARLHWGTRAKLVKAARRDAAIASVAAKQCSDANGLPWKRVTITPVFFFRTRQKRDKGGLIGWLKASEDGLQGVIYHDDEGVEWDDPKIKVGHTEGVVLHIERRE